MDESEVFEMFLQELKDEAARNGESFDLNDNEARQLFDLMQEEFLSEMEDESNFVSSEYETAKPVEGTIEPLQSTAGDLSIDGGNPNVPASLNNSGAPVPLVPQDPERLAKVEALQEALPGLPLSRINNVVNAFEKTLGYPSMLTLVPILRETMPDNVTSRWLKRVNNSNAEFALRKASEDNTVDVSLLNSMLQVKANYGFIQGALDFHADQYKKYGLVRTLSTYICQSRFAVPTLPHTLLFVFSLQLPIVTVSYCKC